MKPTFRIFWHLTVTVIVGLFCFAAGRTSGIHDCQKDYLIRSLMLENHRSQSDEPQIQYNAP